MSKKDRLERNARDQGIIQLPGRNFPAGGGGDVPILGEGMKVVAHALLLDKDLVEERRLGSDGCADFCVAAGKRWGKLQHARDVVQVTLLAAADPEGLTWLPLVGARVALLVSEEGKEEDPATVPFTLMDLCTRGDGATVRIPARPSAVPTEVGRFIRLPIMAGTPIRFEVQSPGHPGALVRFVLHGKQSERLDGKK